MGLPGGNFRLEQLTEYGEHGERRSAVVMLRFFGGLEWKEIAESLGTSVSTAEKDWQAARAWLYGRLK